jgi:hypothetical protein
MLSHDSKEHGLYSVSLVKVELRDRLLRLQSTKVATYATHVLPLFAHRKREPVRNVQFNSLLPVNMTPE